MIEMRLDILTRQWVVFAPERALRPHKTLKAVSEESADGDPFLEGREAETPGETFAIRNPGTKPDTPGWRVRVVPNKFPALQLYAAETVTAPAPTGPNSAAAGGLEFISRPANGIHEVIIECPHFETNLSRLSDVQVTEVLTAYRARINQLRAVTQINHVIIFKNKGAAAGATLPHTHSQLIATTQVPTQMQAQIHSARAYREAHGRSLFADIMNAELRQRTRIIHESEYYVALCPYASRFPFETKILPKQPDCHFDVVTDCQLHDLGAVLRVILRKMEIALDDTPYNFILHTAPFNVDDCNDYSWQLEIIPRLGTLAGYEIGTGDYINIELPETAAQKLRSVSL